MSERVSLFGCTIDALTMDQTVAAIDARIQAGGSTQHCVVNVSKVMLMRDDERLREIVRSCAIVNADGQGIVWAARLLGAALPERVAGDTRRAPLWTQYAGLKWFYRLLQEPRRMWRRYLLGNLRFAALVAAEAGRKGRSGSEA